MEIREYRAWREDEILRLYASVGWTAYTQRLETLRAGFEHSLLTLAAYEDGRLAGLIRTVGDGCTVVLIQDLLVSPEHQRKRIGSALVKAVLARFGGVRQIELLTDQTPRSAAFYRSQGFREASETGCLCFVKE